MWRSLETEVGNATIVFHLLKPNRSGYSIGTMKIQNALKKLERAGFTVVENGQFFTARKVGLSHYVQFTRNGRSDDVATIGVRRNGEKDEPETDYCATSFCDSLAQAMRWALRFSASDMQPGATIHPPTLTTAADLNSTSL
jgi:hypothetical protein